MLIIPGILGLPSWQDFQPFLVTGLSLGGVYALSGVGMVVLYRATGVLNLAFGAVPAAPRYCAICGSTAEIGVQPWAVVILPSLGVTV